MRHNLYVLVSFFAVSVAAIASEMDAARIHRVPKGEEEFVAENGAAMSKMMHGMAVAPSGDIDRDFVAMMVPHHQGAIDMALAELRHGRNKTLKRLAQEIIVTQQQEIAVMRRAVGEPLPPPTPSPTQPNGVPQ